jgi:hypothetical protein
LVEIGEEEEKEEKRGVGGKDEDEIGEEVVGGVCVAFTWRSKGEEGVSDWQMREERWRI